MEKLCFTAAIMPMYAVYFLMMGILLMCYFVLWKNAQVTDSSDGKRVHPSFFKWLLWDASGAFLNCFWFAVLIFNIVRLACTLIFGYAPNT